MVKEIGEVDSIFLGSIGTIVETSEIQRRAFNLAFEKCKIPWTWEQQPATSPLRESGGVGSDAGPGRGVACGALHRPTTGVEGA